ncbi:hypothetical protein O1611_g1459 [Lasiodiplodia mahajangana]|uniref:Uncharacterized protein n=1 Tax=Lasiodiplodia mahajangana TaxID=1108764 RepID=A0ACC2JXX6_9PEZI|nr:hypothetical protein O1611_g1459 [Lasiodiplodia mahajangana]
MDTPDLSQVPAAPPPPGVMPNFSDPPSQQVPMIVVSTVILTLTVIFVAIRVYTGLRILRRFGIEECLTLLATVFSAAYIAVVLHLSHESRHLWDVPLIWFTEDYWKIRYAGNTLQAAVIASGIGFYFRYKLTYTPDINWNEGAYICTVCMPACASLFRSQRGKSGFLTPIRSFLGHYVHKLSTGGGTQGRSKTSYSGDASITGQELHNSSMRRDYIHLQDASQYGAKSVAYYSNDHPDVPLRLNNHHGITKTVALDVV